jgi:hypothetical protein
VIGPGVAYLTPRPLRARLPWDPPSGTSSSARSGTFTAAANSTGQTPWRISLVHTDLWLVRRRQQIPESVRAQLLRLSQLQLRCGCGPVEREDGMARFTHSCAIALLLFPATASAQIAHPTTSAEKIRNALSAAPADIAQNATVIDWPSPPDATPPVLREGSSGWTCLPSPPDTPGNDPLCVDPVFLRFRLALHRGQSLALTEVGLGYMLQGGGGLDGRGVQGLGPHTMMVVPAGGALTQSLESTTPEGTMALPDLVPGALLVVMPVAPGGTTIP